MADNVSKSFVKCEADSSTFKYIQREEKSTEAQLHNRSHPPNPHLHTLLHHSRYIPRPPRTGNPILTQQRLEVLVRARRKIMVDVVIHFMHRDGRTGLPDAHANPKRLVPLGSMRTWPELPV
jgi:hypothetical protein